jgi:hypothetical protein
MVKLPPAISSSLSWPSRAFLPKSPMRLLDLGEAHLSALRSTGTTRPGPADGDAHMDEVLVDDVGAVDLGVDRREFLQRGHAGLHEEGHEAELHAVLLLEGVLVLGAQAITAPSCPPR